MAESSCSPARVPGSNVKRIGRKQRDHVRNLSANPVNRDGNVRSVSARRDESLVSVPGENQDGAS